jgi:hypothetical protein
MIGNLQALYETLFLRDLLGYALPGGVLLLGLAPFTGWCPAWAEMPWLHLVAVVAVFYTTGVGLRLLGTMTSVLVISTDRPGLFGDPGELQPLSPTRRWWERPWRSQHDDSIVRVARMMLGKTDLVSEGQRAIRREAMFMHISGNLGFALLILFLFLSVVVFLLDFWLGRDARHWDLCFATLTTWRQQSLALVVLAGASAVFICGNYIHARAVRLLMRTMYKE